ncbi:MAG: MMPL family transporter, partial [Gaiellales bacterium]
LAAVTLLPALLGMVGLRIERGPVLPAALRGRDQGRSGWARLAAAVMARPWPFIAVTLAVIGVLAAPALSVTINVPRADVLPAGYDSRIGERILDRDFSQAALNPIVVFVPGSADPAGLARRMAALPGVARLAGVQRGPGGSVIDLVPAANPFSSAARDLVRRIRSLPGHGSRFLVTGQTAGELDFLDQIRGRAPWAVALIFAVTYAVLFAAFRSLLLPLKAILMNTLSIGGSFGVLVWVFQDGHLGSLLGVSKLGYVESTLPVVIFCVLFGISMDYEVFMLSRIAERHRAGVGTPAAVAQGLVATGRIITSAAAIVVVIGLSFAFTGVVIVKELGLGLALAIFLDATLIRSLLVPATMRVLGEWNWWPGGRG